MNDIDHGPIEPAGLSRRTVVKFAVVTMIGAAVGSGSTATLTRLGKTAPRRYRFLSAAEAELLIEICEQIIPRDDVAGATDAGVVNYIDRQLADLLARHQTAYRQGLDAFEKTCRRQHGQSFARLDALQKIAIMQQVEAGQAPTELWRGVSPDGFFRLVVDHTMQGFYGSPRHGGNRDYVSYRMLRVDYPQIIGQNRPKAR